MWNIMVKDLYLMKFCCGWSDIEDLAFWERYLREPGKAGLGACLTHGRGELRSSRKERSKNGVKNLNEHKPHKNFIHIAIFLWIGQVN